MIHSQPSILVIIIVLKMKKEDIGKKCDHRNFFVKGYEYNEWYKKMKKNHSRKKLLLKK